MSVRVPDLQQSVVVDLPRGRIESRLGGTERLVALPTSWFARVFEAAGTDALVDALADALAEDARAQLEGETDPTPDDVATALSLALGRRGLGLVGFERWGDLLCVVWRDPPSVARSFEATAEHLLARLVGAVTGLETAAVVIARGEAALTVLLGHHETCVHVRALVERGLGLPALTDHLSAGGEA